MRNTIQLIVCEATETVRDQLEVTTEKGLEVINNLQARMKELGRRVDSNHADHDQRISEVEGHLKEIQDKFDQQKKTSKGKVGIVDK